jgi:hypothetical protein
VYPASNNCFALVAGLVELPRAALIIILKVLLIVLTPSEAVASKLFVVLLVTSGFGFPVIAPELVFNESPPYRELPPAIAYVSESPS